MSETPSFDGIGGSGAPHDKEANVESLPLDERPQPQLDDEDLLEIALLKKTDELLERAGKIDSVNLLSASDWQGAFSENEILCGRCNIHDAAGLRAFADHVVFEATINAAIEHPEKATVLILSLAWGNLLRMEEDIEQLRVVTAKLMESQEGRDSIESAILGYNLPFFQKYPFIRDQVGIVLFKKAANSTSKPFLENVMREIEESYPPEFIEEREYIGTLDEQSKLQISLALSREQSRLPATEMQESLPKFLDDAAVRIYAQGVIRHWPEGFSATLSPSQIVQLQLMVARNLYLSPHFVRPASLTKELVETEINRIFERRNALAGDPLFRGRNVCFVSDTEANLYHPDRPRFGTQPTFDVIQKQASMFTPIRPGEDLRTIRAKKSDVLNAVRHTPPPFTFVFNGHGYERSLCLASEHLNKAIEEYERTGDRTAIKKLGDLEDYEISARELADALHERQLRFGNALQHSRQRDIIIFSCCYNHTFLRDVYSRMENLHDIDKSRERLQGRSGAQWQPPIAVGASEYGQLGFSNLESQYGGSFFEDVCRFGKQGEETTLGDIFRSDVEGKGSSNPSVYVPDEEGDNPMQITKNGAPDASEDIIS